MNFMSGNTSDRLQQIMKERNLKQVDILNKSKPYQNKYNVNLSKSHLSQYVNGKSQPDQHKLFILAETLNVNEAWLMRYDVKKERTPIHTDNEEKTKTNIQTIAAHIDENVTEEEMEDIKRYIDFIKAQRK